MADLKKSQGESEAGKLASVYHEDEGTKVLKDHECLGPLTFRQLYEELLEQGGETLEANGGAAETNAMQMANEAWAEEGAAQTPSKKYKKLCTKPEEAILDFFQTCIVSRMSQPATCSEGCESEKRWRWE